MLYYKATKDIVYNINDIKYIYKKSNNFIWKIWDFDSCTPITNKEIFLKEDYFKILTFFTNTLLPIYGMALDAKIIEIYNDISNKIYSEIITKIAKCNNEDEFINNFIEFLISKNIIKKLSK